MMLMYTVAFATFLLVFSNTDSGGGWYGALRVAVLFGLWFLTTWHARLIDRRLRKLERQLSA
jgi:hypothetical protein